VVAMRALDKKLLRDMKRLWAQALAVALVMACGVATLIIGRGAYQSLLETRSAYYERNAFADIFADAVRVPNRIRSDVREIVDVSAVETRVSTLGLIDVPYFNMPVTGRILSLPDDHEVLVNRIALVEGRLPDAGGGLESVVSKSFANAHGLHAGSRIVATLKGHRVDIAVTGVALSPEFIYAIGPGDMMPDDRRYGIVWMQEAALATLIDMEGAFNSVILRHLPGSSEVRIREDLDRILEPYGGTTAYGRGDQQSHAFLDAELSQLETLSRILPPIFLTVTALLINMVMARLIGLEREQIGLLKALGYTPTAIALHYIKLVCLIAAVGVAIGFAAGTWLGYGLTLLYQRFFHFPYLIFLTSASVYGLAAVFSILSALAGAALAVRRAAILPAAVAMQPPAPPVYRKYFSFKAERFNIVSQLSNMAFRHIVRWPLRATVTASGIAVSIALLVASMFGTGAIDMMLEVTFDRSDRQDVTVSFAEKAPSSALAGLGRLPGVMVVEPFRGLSAELSLGHFKKRVSIIGKPAKPDISRVLDINFQALHLPESGIVLTAALAKQLNARTGDHLHVRLFGEKRRETWLAVAGIVQSYVGIAAFMEIDAMNRMIDEPGLISGAHLLLDPSESNTFFKTAKTYPTLSAFALQRVSLAKFRETIAENINIQMFVYTGLGSIIAFGVAYNSVRIQFSERARELASLRVLGFTEAEVSQVLLLEILVLTTVAVPVGWLGGYGLTWLLIRGFESDLYRVPFVVTRATLAKGALVAIVAVAVSALIVRRRVNRLDLISVLKTKD
jgi:putative ABC transport system permease protein